MIGVIFVLSIIIVPLSITYFIVNYLPKNIECSWFSKHRFTLEHEESVPPQELNNIQKSLILSTDPSRYLKAINGFTFKIYKCKYCNASKIEEGKYNR